jgi:flagellar FliL protein
MVEADNSAKKPEADEKKAGALMPVLMGSLLSGGLMLGGVSYLMQNQAKEMKAALDETKNPKAAAAVAAGAAAVAPAPEAEFYDLDEFLVNLANAGGGRYLRATLSLRYHNGAGKDLIKANQPKVRDVIIDTLTSRTVQDLMSREGKAKLKDELLAELSKLVPDAGIDGVFLQSFTLQ